MEGAGSESRFRAFCGQRRLRCNRRLCLLSHFVQDDTATKYLNGARDEEAWKSLAALLSLTKKRAYPEIDFDVYSLMRQLARHAEWWWPGKIPGMTAAKLRDELGAAGGPLIHTGG